MKSAILLFFALTMLPLPAVEITLEWDSPDAETAPLVASTQLWERKADGTVARIGAAMGGDTSVVINFAEGKHTVYATFVDAAGAVGFPSDDLVFHVLKKPGTPRIKVAFQRSTDLKVWETFAVLEGPEADREFFKVAFFKP